MAALTRDGASARFVGGCVRNALLGAGPTDLDIAVDVEPAETVRLLERAGLRAIPTGLDHGTVTTLAGEEPVEVTSLRRDVATDGRRAVVAFTKDWAEDAARRDFTMNALYADAAGAVYDPLGSGVADLTARRVRFIGRAQERIREDYLRILRFFRFHAWYGRTALAPDDIAAVRGLASGVQRLAKERIGAEIRKLLAAPDPLDALRLMAELGVLEQALPGAEPERLSGFEAGRAALGAEIRWVGRLAALSPSGASDWDRRLRLSNAEAEQLSQRLTARTAPLHEAAYRFGRGAAEDAAAAAGRAGADAATRIARGAGAAFPLTAADLMAAGLPPGPGLGAALRAAERDWIDHEFALDKDALLQRSFSQGS